MPSKQARDMGKQCNRTRWTCSRCKASGTIFDRVTLGYAVYKIRRAHAGRDCIGFPGTIQVVCATPEKCGKSTARPLSDAFTFDLGRP